MLRRILEVLGLLGGGPHGEVVQDRVFEIVFEGVGRRFKLLRSFHNFFINFVCWRHCGEKAGPSETVGAIGNIMKSYAIDCIQYYTYWLQS